MKKLLALLMAVILTLALVGCDDTQSQDDYYTQEEVDELISELQEQNDVLYSTIAELEDIIFENQRRLDEMQQPCYLLELIGDYQKALDDGFTFTIIDGVMYEYKDGIATGDSWIEEDIIADYCNIYD